MQLTPGQANAPSSLEPSPALTGHFFESIDGDEKKITERGRAESEGSGVHGRICVGSCGSDAFAGVGKAIVRLRPSHGSETKRHAEP